MWRTRDQRFVDKATKAIANFTTDPEIAAEALNMVRYYPGVKSCEQAVRVAHRRIDIAHGKELTLSEEFFIEADI